MKPIRFTDIENDITGIVNVSGKSNPIVVRRKGVGKEISCQDFASLAWGMLSNSHSFLHRFSVQCSLNQDFNGSGMQKLEVCRVGVPSDEYPILSVLFEACWEVGWIYEANLIMDGRKDYEPPINRGKHKFCVRSARINVYNSTGMLEFVNDNYIPWEEQLYRCGLPHATLAEWASSRVDMLIKCSNPLCSSPYKVLPTMKLQEFFSSGLDLSMLRTRLTCSVCRRNEPHVFPL